MAKNRPPRVLRQQQKEQPRPQTSVAITAKLQQAVAHHQRGQLAQAETLYREILAWAPTHFDALHFLAGMQYQRGQYQAAVELLQKAIKQKPNHATACANLGLALQQLKNLEKALDSY